MYAATKVIGSTDIKTEGQQFKPVSIFLKCWCKSNKYLKRDRNIEPIGLISKVTDCF